MNEKRQASNKTTAERQNKNRAKSKRAERDKKNSYFCWPHRLHFCFLYFFCFSVVAVALELALFIAYFQLVFLVQKGFAVANPWAV